jgi:hypothetical protein
MFAFVFHLGLGLGLGLGLKKDRTANATLQGDDGNMSLSKLTCAPKKAHRTFARALAVEALAAITEDTTVDPLVRCLKVCSSTGASDWLRAMPGADGAGLLLDAQ